MRVFQANAKCYVAGKWYNEKFIVAAKDEIAVQIKLHSEFGQGIEVKSVFEKRFVNSIMQVK